MARSDRLFKRSYNQALDRVASGDTCSSVSGLARDLNVSRTTARKVKVCLEKGNLISSSKSDRIPARKPISRDYYPMSETRSTQEEIELAFMNWILRERIQPGARISEADLRRRFSASGSTVSEFLMKLSRFGFVRKETRRNWILDGISNDYADELLEFRQVFELRSIRIAMKLPKDDPFWLGLEDIRLQHLDLKSRVKTDYLDMPALDVQFHSLISAASGSRLLPAFSDAVALIFYFHYDHYWDEATQLKNANGAIRDHLMIIDAMTTGDRKRVLIKMEEHLENSRKALEATKYLPT
jgi:DNA-binding GntR family transcriptional regulator